MDLFEKLQSFGVEKWVSQQKEMGKIRNIGFSFLGNPDQFTKLIDAYDWDFCMIQYNYLDEYHQAGTAGLKYAHKKGLPVMVMEPLRGGKLATALPPHVKEVFQKADRGRSMAEWGLRWVWDHKEVTTVLSGMGDEEQLKENVRIASYAAPGTLTEEEHQAYQNVVMLMRENMQVPCTECGYCMPCPQNIDIPMCFSLYNNAYMKGKLPTQGNYLVVMGISPKKTRFASQCIACGACEKKCPQQIQIIHHLKEAAKLLEPFWLKPATKIARTFTRSRARD